MLFSEIRSRKKDVDEANLRANARMRLVKMDVAQVKHLVKGACARRELPVATLPVAGAGLAGLVVGLRKSSRPATSGQLRTIERKIEEIASEAGPDQTSYGSQERDKTPAQYTPLIYFLHAVATRSLAGLVTQAVGEVAPDMPGANTEGAME